MSCASVGMSQISASFATEIDHNLLQARFYLAFSRLHVLDTKLRGADPFDRILGPGQRAELLQELTQGLEAMARGFGPEHMLVRKAEQLQRLYL